jgi:Tfp pilus assembly protein PilO
MLSGIATLLWANKRLVGKIIGVIVVVMVVWWFGFHNPARIAELEAQRTELNRQVAAGQAAAVLLTDIYRGKEEITNATFKRISSIKAATLPRGGVLITGGVSLSSGLLKTSPAH